MKQNINGEKRYKVNYSTVSPFSTVESYNVNAYRRQDRRTPYFSGMSEKRNAKKLKESLDLLISYRQYLNSAI